jgi:hypothetical protein
MAKKTFRENIFMAESSHLIGTEHFLCLIVNYDGSLE